MKVYSHSANIIREISQGRKGFKTAFYDYLEENKKDIGNQMKQIYSLCINVYKRLDDITKAMNQVFSAE